MNKNIFISILFFLSTTTVYSCDTVEALAPANTRGEISKPSNYYDIVSDHRTVHMQENHSKNKLFNNNNVFERFVFRLDPYHDILFERVKRYKCPNFWDVLNYLSYNVQHPPAQFMLGTILQKYDFTAQAAALIWRAADEGLPCAQIARAIAAYRRNDLDEAKKNFDLAAQPRIVRLSSLDTKRKFVYNTSLMDWAIIKAEEGNFFDAELLFQQSLDRRQYDMLYYLGILYAQFGDKQRALEQYKKTLVHPHVSADIKNKALQKIFDTQSGQMLHGVAVELTQQVPGSAFVRLLLQESSRRGFETAFRILLQAYAPNNKDMLCQLLEEALQNRRLTISDESTIKIIGQIFTQHSEKSKDLAYIAYKIYRDGSLGLAKDSERAKIFFLRAVKNGYFLHNEEMPKKKDSRDHKTVAICLDTLKVLKKDFHPDLDYARVVVRQYLAELASGKQANVYAVVHHIQTQHATMEPSQMSECVQKLVESKTDDLVPYLLQEGCLKTIVTYAEQHQDHHDLLCSCSRLLITAIKQKQIESSNPLAQTMSDLLFRQIEQNLDTNPTRVLATELSALSGDMPSLLYAIQYCMDNFEFLKKQKSNCDILNRCIQQIKDCADRGTQEFAADAAYVIKTFYDMIQVEPSFMLPCLLCKKENINTICKRYGDKAKGSLLELVGQAEKTFSIGDLETTAKIYYQLYIASSNHNLSRFSDYYKNVAYKALEKLAQHQQAPPLACLVCCVLEQNDAKRFSHFISALNSLFSLRIPPKIFENYAQKTKALQMIERYAEADDPQANHLLGEYYSLIGVKKDDTRVDCIEKAERYAKRAHQLDPQNEGYKNNWVNCLVHLADVYTDVDRIDDAFRCLDCAATFGNDTTKGEVFRQFAALYASGKLGTDKEASKKSREFLEQAAACGDLIARSELDTISKEVSAAERVEDLKIEGLISLHDQALELYRAKEYQKAKELFEESVTKGCKLSLFFLAILNMNGYGTPKDVPEALRLLEEFEQDLHANKFYIPEFRFSLAKRISKSYADIAQDSDVTPQIKTRALCN